MKTLFLFTMLASSLSFLSCNSQVKTPDEQSSYKAPNADTSAADHTSPKTSDAHNAAIAQGSKVNHVPIKYFDIKDTSNGMSTGTIPLPENFEMNTTGKYLFTGPNGISISGLSLVNYAYSNNQQEVYNFRMMGANIKYPQSIDQIIEDTFVPYGNKINRKLIKSYPLPEVANFYRQFDGLIYKLAYGPKVFESRGIEWEDPDGTSYLTILTRNQETGPQAHFWGYVYSVMESPKAQFEQAKRIFINSLVNQEINYQWIQNANEQLKRTLDASDARFQAQRAAVQHNTDVFKAAQAQRHKDEDAHNEQMYDYLTNRTTVVDPTTGAQRKPESGATYYWYNENGDHITSDKSYYDPNKDPAMNQEHTWTLNKSKY